MRTLAPGAVKSSTFTIALAGIAARSVKRVFLALRNRHAVARLTDLDDRALKDIGLLRTDVYAALATPLHSDPSVHLTHVAGYKRGGGFVRDVAGIDSAVETLLRPERQGYLRRAAEAVRPQGVTPAAC